MNKAQRDIRRKTRVLEHAARIGNVRKTCRYFGVARSGFYVWKKAYETHGDEGLVNQKPWPVQPTAPHTPRHRREGPPSPPHVSPLGPIRIVWDLERYHGITISKAGVHRIWDKGHIVIGRGHYHWRHESCWYAVKKGAQANWAGDRKASTLWEIDNPRKSETGHSAQKPVECMQRAIHNHKGDVYDPFVGSGTTLIACEQEGRTVYALEIEPAYVDVSVKRWEDFTGQKAQRKK